MNERDIELSIIIVNYHTKKELLQCILSITKSRIDVNYEIIIIDNSSEIDTLNIDRTLPVCILHNNWNVGFAKAVNRGIRHARGEYILLLNPDTEVEDDTIEALLQFTREKKDMGCVAPAITYPDGKIQPSARSFPTLCKVFGGRDSLLTRLFPDNPITRSYLLMNPNNSTPKRVDWVTGACMMTRKARFDEVGLFDEKFFLFLEDVDFCYRLKKVGYNVYYLPSVKVVHKSGTATSKNWERSLLAHNVGMLIFLEKHYNLNIILRYFLYFAIALRILFLITLREFMEKLKDMGLFVYSEKAKKRSQGQ